MTREEECEKYRQTLYAVLTYLNDVPEVPAEPFLLINEALRRCEPVGDGL